MPLDLFTLALTLLQSTRACLPAHVPVMSDSSDDEEIWYMFDMEDVEETWNKDLGLDDGDLVRIIVAVTFSEHYVR